VNSHFFIIFRIKNDLVKFVLLFAEIEGLRARVNAKENENEALRKSAL